MKHVTTIELTPETRQMVKELMAREGRSMNNLINQVIREKHMASFITDRFERIEKAKDALEEK